MKGFKLLFEVWLYPLVNNLNLRGLFQNCLWIFSDRAREQNICTSQTFIYFFLSTAVKIHQYSDCIVLINTFLPDFLKTFKICKVWRELVNFKGTANLAIVHSSKCYRFVETKLDKFTKFWHCKSNTGP